MPVFVSHSHHDRDFVDKLATQLVKAQTPVWLDRWELNVGDSLIRRIEEAVAGASALVLVLSKASVASEWCRKELSAGLVRELSEKRVVVLPVLLEDCDVPLFLRDKKFADFRSDLDEGLRELLKAVAFIANDARSRIEEPSWHTDWAIDWGLEGAYARYTLTFVEQAVGHPYSCLVTMKVRGNKGATAQYHSYSEAGLARMHRQLVVATLAEKATERDLRVLLSGPFPATVELDVLDRRLGIKWTANAECRILGNDTGADVLLNIAGMLRSALAHIRASTVPLDKEQQERVDALISSFR